MLPKNKKLKKMLLKLEQTQRRLIQLEKMSILGRLVAGIAHEIKNPLSIVLSGSEFLESKLSRANKETKETLTEIKKAAIRADKIIKSLLAFSKPSKIELEYANINDIIDGALPLIEHQMSLANIDIKKDLFKNIPKVYVNKNQIQQVLINILVNASEAMPKGGEVKIRTYTKKVLEVGPKSGRRFTDYFKIGDRVVALKIEDTGCGIPKKYLSKIFEPFFTTKKDAKSIGLGLSTSQAIIDAHKGTIEIDSKINKGTKVTIILPPAP